LLSALFLYFLPTSQAPGVAHEGDTVAHHRSGVFLFALLIASFGFVSCSGLVAGNNGNPPLITLAITNVLTGPATTSSCQVDWTTNIQADSAVDYGTSTVYGSSTPVDPSMVTSHQVVLSGLAPGTVYYYQVRSTDSKSNNAHSSSHSFKTSGGGPSITMQPTSQTVTAGQTASFSVAATGTAPLSYQWNRNGAGISGATSSTYSTPATTSSDNGAQFTVVVSNTAGTVTSSAATLSVTAAAVPPSITTQPTNQTVTAGQVAMFSVSATGTAPLSYQWRKNGTAITAASSSSYSTPATTSSDNGAQFTVVVSNSAGTVTSSAATLTVNAAPVPPSITTQPASQTVTAGQTAAFSVVATGTAPLSYQWYRNGTVMSGAVSASYTTAATTSSDNGAQFTVVVSNTAGSVTSSAATLTVNATPVAPSITTQPANQTVTAGQVATFSVTATGTAPLSYQWQKNSAAITGATSSTYTTPATTSSDNGTQFTVMVSNTAGSVTSSVATLTVNAAPVAPTITAQPANLTVTVGQTASFTVVATGTAPLSYQWQKNSVNIAGATAASYTTPATTTSDSGSTFRVVASNTAGTATSATATLTVNAVAPSITTQPISQTVTAGQTASFSVTATGTAPLNYQWRKNSAAITGATSSTYTTPATTSSDNGAQFTVVVTNTAGSVTSSAATLTVNAQPLQIATTSLPTGHVLTAYSSTLQATGGTPPYTWSLSSGLLPNGLTISSNGTISGTPALAGLFTFVIHLGDSAGAAASTTLSIDIAAAAPVVAFPGAQGGGANSVGGRGGAVYLVTNTADSGVGSLRTCIDASGPRTCVFRTGGTIALLSTLTVVNPFLTIAGQTAPGGGIQITGPSGAQAPGNPSIQVRTHDVVIQYLRIRRGYNPGEICNQNPWSCGMGVEVLAQGPPDDPYNIMFDHIDAEWADYDALAMAGHPNAGANQPRAITVSNSILGEELAGAGQATGAVVGGYSGLGSTAEDLEVDVDFHHNLLAGTSHRMPLTTQKSGRMVNNIIYAWTYYAMRSKGLRDIIGNYFALRTGQILPSHEIQAWTTNDGNDTSFAPSFYVTGNGGPSDPTGASNWALMTALAANESAGEASSPLGVIHQSSLPIPTPSGYIPIVADAVATISSASGPMLNTGRTAPYDGVGASRQLDCKGKWIDARDSVDNRIVSAVVNGTTLYGTYDYSTLANSPQSQADLGGWPVLTAGIPCADSTNSGMPDTWQAYWAGVFGLGITLNPKGLNFGDGYTNLEHFINGVSPSP
jgi:hypothetical protein